MKLTLCPCCHRHVKSAEHACPFCSAAMPDTTRPPIAAAMVLGLGLAVAGCSSSSTTSVDRDATTEDAKAHQDANHNVADGPAHELDAGKDAWSSDANHAIMYGPPAPDAGKDTGPGMGSGAYAPPAELDAGDTAIGGAAANDHGA